MLESVRSLNNGIRVGNHSFNILAYADDVTLYSSTIPGLQTSIDACVEYSKLWRFCFNPHKSKCMTIGPKLLSDPPSLYLDSEPVLMYNK